MMLADARTCTGCSACRKACARNAITMEPDEMGFLYPRIDSAKCVNCELCAKACPVLNVPDARSPRGVFVARAKDSELLKDSTSGGAFTVLAERFIHDGGVVYGVAWDKATWRAVFRRADIVEELAPLRGTKYIQADMGETLNEIAQRLKIGGRIMFVGTPCQVAGVKQLFTDCRQGELFTVAIVCASSLSPEMLRRFMTDELGERIKELKNIKFRDKKAGWHQYVFRYCFENGDEDGKYREFFLGGKNRGIFARESCGECKFVEFRCGADLTIGDAWGARFFAPDLSDETGASEIWIGSEAGERLLSSVMDKIEGHDADVALVASRNRPVLKTAGGYGAVAMERAAVRRALAGDGDFIAVCRRIFRLPLHVRIRLFLGRLKRRLTGGLK